MKVFFPLLYIQPSQVPTIVGETQNVTQQQLKASEIEANEIIMEVKELH